MPACALGLWVAIHRVEWLGPLLADSARAVVGPEPVAKLEDVAYAIEDRWNRFWRRDERPQAYWEVPASPQRVVAPSPAAAEQLPAFSPRDVPPMHTSFSAPGDGQWVPVVDPRHSDEPPRMYKTLLHPDRNRSWAAVSIVAADLRQVELHLMPGRHEPKATEQEAQNVARPGLIPADHQSQLLAAFNGGFKLEHGHYGMRVDGLTFVRPRNGVCSIAMFDDRLVIRTWEAIAESEKDMLWWRQTPPCMFEQGKLHPGLTVEKNTRWGATLDGDTVIRRSAIGASADGKTVYVGIGDSTTATAIAKAMHHAGAHDVAQLDVNWSYPKFVLFGPRDPGAQELIATALCKGFEFTEDDYVRKASPRDFFYLTRRNAPQASAD